MNDKADRSSSDRTGQDKHCSIPFNLPTRLFANSSSSSSIVLECIDCHAAGEPARVVLSGVPDCFPKESISALLKRAYMMEHLDHLRSLLLLEPRGYPCQNANFIFLPDDDNGKNDKPLQYVIVEQNKIYPLMSGHNTICVATALLECGVIKMQTPVTKFILEAPAGPIEINAKCTEQGKAISITLTNTPSFVNKLDVLVKVPEIGHVTCDIAYGGMWYAIVDLQQQENLHLNLQLDPSYASQLCRIGEMIKVACREQFPVQHPTQDYPGVDILAFRGKAGHSNAHSRNAVVMSNNKLQWDKPETWTAMLDRSPCGTGTCAIMAVLHARGMLKVGEPFVHESIIGTLFTGKILKETSIANEKIPAIIPQIEGSAYITQYSKVVLDAAYDPFPEGYRVNDIW